MSTKPNIFVCGGVAEAGVEGVRLGLLDYRRWETSFDSSQLINSYLFLICDS